MATRSRTIRKEVHFTENEWEMVLVKMEQLGTTNYNGYLRKMSIDGYVIKHDFSDIKKLTAELGKIGSNVNQIAKRANETRTIHQNDVAEILKQLHNIQVLVNDKVGKLISKKG